MFVVDIFFKYFVICATKSWILPIYVPIQVVKIAIQISLSQNTSII